MDPGKLADRTPEYRKIIGFRKILTHGYDIIDVAAMWDFVQNLLKMRSKLQKTENPIICLEKENQHE